MKDLLLYSDGGDNSIDEEYGLEIYSKYGKQLYFKVEVENGREFLFKKNPRFLNSTSFKWVGGSFFYTFDPFFEVCYLLLEDFFSFKLFEHHYQIVIEVDES